MNSDKICPGCGEYEKDCNCVGRELRDHVDKLQAELDAANRENKQLRDLVNSFVFDRRCSTCRRNITKIENKTESGLVRKQAAPQKGE